MEYSFVKTWIVEPHLPETLRDGVAMGFEGLFLAFAIGDFAKMKFKSAGASLFIASIFYAINRFY